MSHLQQPLLYPSAHAHHHAHHSSGPPHLVLAAAHLDASKPRPVRDALWARLYAALMLACGALWALSALTQARAYDILVDADAFLNDPTNCPATKGPWGPVQGGLLAVGADADAEVQAQLAAWRAAGGVGKPGGDADALPALLRTTAGLLGLSLLLALAISCVFVLLVQHVPGVLVFITVLVQVSGRSRSGVAGLGPRYRAHTDCVCQGQQVGRQAAAVEGWGAR